jgi:hypothetical protein
MAHLLGDISRGAAYLDPLSVDRCVHALQALHSETQLHERTLPLTPSELPFIVLTRAGGRIGVVDAPSCPPASSCFLYCLQKRLNAGRSAAFVLAPTVDVMPGDLYAAVLAKLADLVQVNADLQHPGSLGVPPTQLSVACEPSSTHGGVLIAVSVPASAPEGSRVVVSRASVAGCDAALGGEVHVIVGFNSTPAPAGPVMAAAEAGDVPALMRLLEGGAPTEENDAVSGERLGTIRP